MHSHIVKPEFITHKSATWLSYIFTLFFKCIALYCDCVLYLGLYFSLMHMHDIILTTLMSLFSYPVISAASVF